MFTKILGVALLAAYVQAQGYGQQKGQANSYISYTQGGGGSSNAQISYAQGGGGLSLGNSGIQNSYPQEGSSGSSYISYTQGGGGLSVGNSGTQNSNTYGGLSGSSYISYAQGGSGLSLRNSGSQNLGSYISYAQGGSSNLGGSSNYHEEPKAYPKYSFKYGVEDKHTGDIKQQEETRDGDSVKGYYTLHEPDGTILIVHYTVEKKSGFNAVVERRGHAAHPQYSSKN